MNRFSNSLINKVKFLGLILALLMFFILFIAYKTSTIYTKKNYIHHAIKISELLQSNSSELEQYLLKHNIQKSQYKKILPSLKKADPLVSDMLIREIFAKYGIELFANTKNIFFVIKYKNKLFYFKNESNFLTRTLLPILIPALLFLLILYGIYHYITNAFSPLVRLKKNITHFSREEEIDGKYENAKDEIAHIANAFYAAIEHNKKLKIQKDMYICMVMHEISTPLTKAKFITHFMENEKDKESLNALFNSMQYELDKVYEFERISSKILHIKTGLFSINALIEDVCDVLLLDKKNINITAQEVHKIFDYNLFIVSVKNLIDNALKYSKDSKVIVNISQKSLEIKNLSSQNDALDIHKLLEPFKQGNECNSGMGLGLFLVNEIIIKHNFSLEYNFNDNYHIFTINFYP